MIAPGGIQLFKIAKQRPGAQQEHPRGELSTSDHVVPGGVYHSTGTSETEFSPSHENFVDRAQFIDSSTVHCGLPYEIFL